MKFDEVWEKVQTDKHQPSIMITKRSFYRSSTNLQLPAESTPSSSPGAINHLFRPSVPTTATRRKKRRRPDTQKKKKRKKKGSIPLFHRAHHHPLAKSFHPTITAHHQPAATLSIDSKSQDLRGGRRASTPSPGRFRSVGHFLSRGSGS